MIFKSKDGKFIGQLRSTTFFKSVRRSTHMLREPEAWAIDKDVVDTLALVNCKTIQIFETEHRVVWTVKLVDFNAKSIIIDRGHGQQKALPLIYWKFKPAFAGARPIKYTPEAYNLRAQLKGVSNG